jgi:Holliday junction resolvase-like predicted endonuclease
MSNKSKGRRNEYKAIKILRDQGYQCTRSAASLGVWDIIAISETHIKLVQVKTNKMPSQNEIKNMRDYKAPTICSKEVWLFKDKEPLPIIKVVGDI